MMIFELGKTATFCKNLCAKFIIIVFNDRCCEEFEVLPSSNKAKQKSNTTTTGTSFTIRCEPNPLNQTSYAQPGGFSEEYLRNGGKINKRNRLFRETDFTCHHNKKWDPKTIAQPGSAFNNKAILGHLSDNGANLMVKFNPRFIEQNIVKNLEMPLTSFDHYCVSDLRYMNC